MRSRLGIRDALVQTRTRYISLIRALLRQQGYRVPSGSAEGLIQRVRALPLPGRLLSVIAPLLAVMRHLNHQLAYSDATIEHLAVQDPRVPRLRSVPSIGCGIGLLGGRYLSTGDYVKVRPLRRRLRQRHPALGSAQRPFVFNEMMATSRTFRAIDLFHDTAEALEGSGAADRRLLQDHGFAVRVLAERADGLPASPCPPALAASSYLRILRTSPGAAARIGAPA